MADQNFICALTLFLPGAAWQWAGGLVCLFVLAQLAIVTLTAVRRVAFERRRQRLSLEVLHAQLDAARKLQQKREAAALGWNGYRKFSVHRKVMEAENICSFYLTAHDKKPIPAFQPGQYLTFKLDIPGQKKEVIRCYSLSDRPRADHYRVTIKKLTPPPDRPGAPCGLVSGFFHDQLKEGDILDVKAPSGRFVLDTIRESPVVLIGGGIGLTPVLSMLNEIVESGSKRETWLFFGVRNPGEHLMREHLLQVARRQENVHLRIYYSRAGENHPNGQDYIYAGRVTADVLKQTLPSNNYSFYLCGPGAMMNDLTRGLKEWGVPDSQVFFETFGPASVKQTPVPAATAEAVKAEAAKTIKVVFGKTGKTAPWDVRSGSLLEFAEAQGISISFGCRAGNCGTCLTALKSGEVAYLQETGARPEPGSCLACVCVPRTDVVLDA
jgi:ferredoxin-NADP reductase